MRNAARFASSSSMNDAVKSRSAATSPGDERKMWTTGTPAASPYTFGSVGHSYEGLQAWRQQVFNFVDVYFIHAGVFLRPRRRNSYGQHF